MARTAGLLVLGVAAAAWCASSSAAPGQRDKGLEPARSTAEELARSLGPRRLALVVGVDHYDDPVFGDLRHAVDDAAALAGQLSSAAGGGFDDVVLLADDGEVTRARVLAQLKVLATSVRREDVVVIYFSGHGTLVPDDDGTLAPFLLVADSRARDLRSTALDLAAIQRFVASVPAQRKALIVDACFNGDGKSALGPRTAEAAAALEPDRSMTSLGQPGVGEALLFATTMGRPAREDDELGHGTYTYYLLEALSWEAGQADLDGDGLITAYEAHDWARRRVVERTGGVQQPEAAFRVVGVHDVVLAGDPALRRASDRALVYAYLPAARPYRGARLAVDGRDKGGFPGTVATEAGRHRFQVRDRGGALLFEGSATVGKGQVLSVEDLRALVREDRQQMALQVGYLGGPPAAWSALWGDGMVAIQVWSAARRAAPGGRGLFLGGALGVGVAPARTFAGRTFPEARTAFWLAPQVGWGRDVRRFRVRAALELRATLLPVDPIGRDGDDDAVHATEAGWFFLSAGPTLCLGLVVSDRVAVVAGGDLQIAALDLNGDGRITANPFGGVSLGIEVGL